MKVGSNRGCGGARQQLCCFEVPETTPQLQDKWLAFDLLYTLALYYIFRRIIISDILFILSGLSLVAISLPAVYCRLDYGIFLFLIEIMLAISYDNEDASEKSSPRSHVFHLLPIVDLYRAKGGIHEYVKGITVLGETVRLMLGRLK